ncbi:MAG: repeat containing protein [Verrucomicrobiota bacterium]|jgi:tetratricopeptide (TPR) repeat protein
MNRLLVALALLLAGRPALHAASGPEERYVEVVALIQEADQLADAGQARDAIPRYVEAQAALKQLQTAFPEFSPKIVAFRLGHVTARLEPLTRQPAAPPPIRLSPGEILTNELRRLQEEVIRVGNQNALLEAKLREALLVQPAASDPRELRKAEERLAQLQKERDLLNVTVEQLRQQVSTPPPPAPSAPDQQALAEARRELAARAAAEEGLRRQNEALRRQLEEAARARPPAVAPSSPGESREAVAMLQASNRVLQAELVALETRLLDWIRTHGKSVAPPPAPNPAPNPSGAAEAARQVEALRARLQVFEAKAVPFSPEELALFQRPPPRTPPDTNPPPVAVAGAVPAASGAARDPLPPAAAPVLAAADRAIDAGRYEEAEGQFRALLEKNPDQPYLLARLASAQLDQDKVGPAETHLQKLLALEPRNPAALQMMGDVKYRQAKFDESVTLLGQAVQARPEVPETQFRLGQALIATGQRQAAEASFRKSLQLRPGWGEPHYQLAVLYATQQPGYPELAQYHYKRAIAGGMPRNPNLERVIERRPAP